MISALQKSPLPLISATAGVSPLMTPISADNPFLPAATGAPSAASGSAYQSGRLSAGTLQQLIQVQSQQPATASGGANSAVGALITLGAKGAASGQISLNDNYKSTLFNLASGNSGNLTRSDLEQSVIAGGGTAKEADALFDQIDQNGSGAVSQKEMAGQLATPTSGGSFGDALFGYLQASGDLQQTLMQQLMGIGLTQDQANSLAQQMQSTGLS
jgi:hypothetical protein